jgi:hypothetical protein
MAAFVDRKRRPGKQAQAQIDGAGVQSVDRVVQIDPKRGFAQVELACAADKDRCQVGPDAPIARFVGIRQRGSSDGRAKAHRIELAGIGRETGLDVAQALSPRQLRECHGSKLLGAGQRPHARVASVALHDASEAGPWHELHDLSEQGLADVHGYLPSLLDPAKYAVSRDRSSSRHQTKSAYSPRQCSISASALII